MRAGQCADFDSIGGKRVCGVMDGAMDLKKEETKHKILLLPASLHTDHDL